eukprot:28195-Pelagococcus_subviridis.AAC.2
MDQGSNAANARARGDPRIVEHPERDRPTREDTPLRRARAHPARHTRTHIARRPLRSVRVVERPHARARPRRARVPRASLAVVPPSCHEI